MERHVLKILPEYFQEVWDGKKTFELRKDDRNYNVGDILVLREYTNGYTGNTIEVVVTHILRNCTKYGLADGYCILSIKRHSDLNAEKVYKQRLKSVTKYICEVDA